LSNNIIPIINQTHHDLPPDSPSFQTEINPFNHNYNCQYQQDFIDGMDQQLHQTPYNNDELHMAYGQGRDDKYDYLNS